MTHIRQQLRDKVKILVEAATGMTVYLNRVKVLKSRDLPCVIATTSKETLDYQNIHDGVIRDVQLELVVYQRALDDVDDELDGYCSQIETAMDDDATIVASEKRLEATSIEVTDDGDQPIATAAMLYSVIFFDAGDPEKVI